MKRLLLIDDSKFYLAVIEKFLSECSIELHTVATFAEAEELIVRLRPDIVCVDQHVADPSLTGEDWLLSKHLLLGTAEIAIVTGAPESIKNGTVLDLLGVEVVQKANAKETRFWQRIKRQSAPKATTVLSSSYLSAFISYGGPDESFAKHLYLELQRHGVPSFLFAENAPLGKKLHRVMREGIESHDRVLLLCSEASLNRPGVMNEIEETLAREAREGGGERLIPLALDDYIYSSWHPTRQDLAIAVRNRVIGDFRGTREAPELLSTRTTRLLQALRAA